LTSSGHGVFQDIFGTMLHGLVQGRRNAYLKLKGHGL